MSFAQVLQIPVARPIFLREVSNRMYGTTSYYFAACTASVITFCLYPIISSCVSFPYFGFEASSFTDLLHWVFIMSLIGLAGSFWGFMIGSFAKNEVTAVQINLVCAYIFSFGGGFYANTGDNQNTLVRVLTYISPVRFSTELLMRRVLAERPEADMVLDQLGFTWGETICIVGLIIFIIFGFLVGWASLLFKTRGY